MLLAVLIFVATITLVIWQPRGLGIGWSAMGGAVVALLAGVVSLSDGGVEHRVERDGCIRRGHPRQPAAR